MNTEVPLEACLPGKTIASTEWVGGEEGYGEFKIKFTDGSCISVNYSCMGGVYLSNGD